jgi:hypothetical protein
MRMLQRKWLISRVFAGKKLGASRGVCRFVPLNAASRKGSGHEA